MLNDTTDMLKLRWRTAQWLLAAAEGDKRQMSALREAMRIEQIDSDDVLDEVALLQRQFGHRPIAVLRNEVTQLWLRLGGRS